MTWVQEIGDLVASAEEDNSRRLELARGVTELVRAGLSYRDISGSVNASGRRVSTATLHNLKNALELLDDSAVVADHVSFQWAYSIAGRTRKDDRAALVRSLVQVGSDERRARLKAAALEILGAARAETRKAASLEIEEVSKRWRVVLLGVDGEHLMSTDFVLSPAIAERQLDHIRATLRELR